MKAKISEVFKSPQGEGPYQGIEQVFVRFSGCNLSCHFCDTKLDFYSEKTVSEVMQIISSYDNYHSVSLTGGEPLLQVGFLKSLVQNLKRDGKIIYLETNGTLGENLSQVIDYIDIIAMDFKLPSSTKLGDFWLQHRQFLKIAKDKEVFVKAVISKDTHIEDLEIASAVLKEVKKSIGLILQPENPFEDLLEEELKIFEKICQLNQVNVKILPQLHKRVGLK